MFDKTTIKNLKQELLDRNSAHEKEIRELRREHIISITEKEREIESQEKILRAELQTKINEAAKESEEINAQLREDNAVLKKEVEILEKAFENMGFDVKDMKGILTKLVDGIVASNEVKIINPN